MARSEDDGGFERVSRSIASDRQVHFAVEKLLAGYSLIVSDDRRSAVFFRVGRGYEGCAFRVARTLIDA